MMRGSLDRPKKKSDKEGLDRPQTKKAKGGVDSSHRQAKTNHGQEAVQQSNMNMGDISPSNMQNLDKATSMSSKGSFERTKLKTIRASHNRTQTQVKPTYANDKVQERNTNMDDITLPDTLSLQKAKRKAATQSFERGKLKPVRANLHTEKSKVKPTCVNQKVEESSINMDGMALPDMLRFLDKEEALLTQLQSKMSDELSRLQVEEHVFLHTLKILSQKHPPNKVNENQQQSSSGDQELIDALNEALTENGDSVPSNLDKGEETTEE
eukprot:c23969_g5_i1 orf=60-863(+)